MVGRRSRSTLTGQPDRSDNVAMPLPPDAETPLSALSDAPPGHWVALSSDKTRTVAVADSFDEVAAKADQVGEPDPVIVFVSEDWTPLAL